MSRPCDCTTGTVCALHVTRVSVSCGCTSVLRCALHQGPTFRSCLHDCPEDEICSRCLADVPEPKVPALSGRRVLSPEQGAPGFVLGDKHAIVAADDARRLAVIDSAIAEDASVADGIRNDAAFARRRAEDFEERARLATGEADRARRAELEDLARNARRWEALYLALLGAEPAGAADAVLGAGPADDVPHAPKVQPSPGPEETQ